MCRLGAKSGGYAKHFCPESLPHPHHHTLITTPFPSSFFLFVTVALIPNGQMWLGNQRYSLFRYQLEGGGDGNYYMNILKST